MDIDGKLSPCDSLTHITLGSIQEDGIEDVVSWKNLLRAEETRRIEKSLHKCSFCRWMQVCNGGCAASVQTSTGQLLCHFYKRYFAGLSECIVPRLGDPQFIPSVQKVLILVNLEEKSNKIYFRFELLLRYRGKCLGIQ